MSTNIKPYHRRGSVLVFAVVVLAVLAMLATAFLIVARHAIAASKFGLSSPQAEHALAGAQSQARNSLFYASKGNFIYTPNGVIIRDTNVSGLESGPGLTPTAKRLGFVQDGEFDNTGAATNSPHLQFVHDLGYELDPANKIIINNGSATHAVLSSYHYDPHFIDSNNKSTIPFFTTAPIRLRPYENSTVTDRASGFFMRADFTDFATDLTNRRKLAPIGTIRGRHFVWVRDLDANLYAVPAHWGLNTRNIPGYIYDEKALATGILDYLRTTPASGLIQTMKTTDPAVIAALSPAKMFECIGAFAQEFPGYENDPAFQLWRADIESYFSTCLDAEKDVNGNYRLNSHGGHCSRFKSHPAALNINTAPEEVIQAILSQIPYSIDRSVNPAMVRPLSYKPSAAPSLAELLAKRIVAKRPFLCRMDFEDFLASLLVGDPNDIATPVGAIKLAISRRINNEIRLSQYMEIPGLPENHPIYGAFDDTVTNNGVTTNVTRGGANSTEGMVQRFEYFLLDRQEVHNNPASFVDLNPTRASCALTLGAFNNILNSLSSSPGPYFRGKQIVVSGTTGMTTADRLGGLVIDGRASTPADVARALDGIVVGGDDVVQGDKVYAGENGIAETEITGFSYYSHDYTKQEYKPARFHTTPIAPDDPTVTSPALCGKFIYGIPNADPALNFAPAQPPAGAPLPDGSTPPPTVYKSYGMVDLHSWSCVGDGTLSGYYDMWFNPHDKMVLDIGEKLNTTPPAKGTEPCIISDSATLPLLTGSAFHDDEQVVNFDEPSPQYGIVVAPGPNGTLETQEKAVSITNDPSGQNGRAPDDHKAKVIRLSVNYPTTVGSKVSSFDKIVTAGTYQYIISKDGSEIVTEPAPPNPLNPDPNDVDQYINVIIDGGNSFGDTSVSDDVRDEPNKKILIGKNITCNTAVWGGLRASQRGVDIMLPSASDQPGAAVISSGESGDVAWSPQICFRSRFFGTYVLAQGLQTQPKSIGQSPSTPAGSNIVTFTCKGDGVDLSQVAYPGALLALKTKATVPAGTQTILTNVYVINSFTGSGTTVTLTLSSPLLTDIVYDATTLAENAAIYSTKVTGERRIESLYDSIDDKVLWQHSPLTEKRALGDPD